METSPPSRVGGLHGNEATERGGEVSMEMRLLREGGGEVSMEMRLLRRWGGLHGNEATKTGEVSMEMRLLRALLPFIFKHVSMKPVTLYGSMLVISQG